MRGLSDSLFDIHQPDVVALKARLRQRSKSDEEIEKLPHSYFKKRYGGSHCCVRLHSCIYRRMLHCFILGRISP